MCCDRSVFIAYLTRFHHQCDAHSRFRYALLWRFRQSSDSTRCVCVCALTVHLCMCFSLTLEIYVFHFHGQLFFHHNFIIALPFWLLQVNLWLNCNANELPALFASVECEIYVETYVFFCASTNEPINLSWFIHATIFNWQSQRLCGKPDVCMA